MQHSCRALEPGAYPIRADGSAPVPAAVDGPEVEIVSSGSGRIRLCVKDEGW